MFTFSPILTLENTSLAPTIHFLYGLWHVPITRCHWLLIRVPSCINFTKHWFYFSISETWTFLFFQQRKIDCRILRWVEVFSEFQARVKCFEDAFWVNNFIACNQLTPQRRPGPILTAGQSTDQRVFYFHPSQYLRFYLHPTHPSMPARIARVLCPQEVGIGQRCSTCLRLLREQMSVEYRGIW